MASNENKPPQYNPPFFGPGKLDKKKNLVSTDRIKGFTDITDRYANQGYYIEFEYLHGDPSVNKVAFKSFITDYQDNFTSNWNTEEVYGRPDPIHTFQNTTRTINLSWYVPSADFIEAEANVAKASKLMRFLYPSYTQEGNTSTMTKPPLLRLKFTNLVKKNSTQGLLGKASGFSFTPDVDAGWWDGNPMDPDGGQGQLYPKLLKFTCEFSVIHEHHLGWHDCDGQWEVVCGEDGIATLDPDKKGWPYIPFRSVSGADAILGQTIVTNEDGTTRALQQSNDFREANNSLNNVKKSSMGAQGATTSDQTKAKNAANPNPESQPAGQPEAEEEAEAQGQLGN